MSRMIVEPVTTARVGSPTSESVTTHPAFGQIAASRVNGHTALYDSDFTHNAYIVIRLSQSELHRNLNSDWHFSKREGFVEVAMSEAQWATFVSSLNMGSGVPCTLQRLNGAMVPGLPDPKPRSDQFGAEVREDLADSIAAMRDLDTLIDELGLPKGKAAQLKGKLHTAEKALSDAIPWVAKQFEQHMEETVEAAKAEVHGYMTGVLQRAGLEQLTGGVLPLQIEDSSDA